MLYREMSTPKKVNYPQEIKGLQLYVWLRFAAACSVITLMLRGRKDALTKLEFQRVRYFFAWMHEALGLRMLKKSILRNSPFAVRQMIEALVLTWKRISLQTSQLSPRL